MSKRPKLGIIQSRGLGDIIIALPIARYYADQGYDIIWPICDVFMPNVERHIPWVQWVPVPIDSRGRFFYDEPMLRLKNLKCDEIMCLYQALTGHNFHDEKYFQYTKFDQYKYIQSGVPFLNKWRLAECITRDPQAEQTLAERLAIDPAQPYAVVHLQGSDHMASFDFGMIPQGWRVVEIEEGLTSSVFDWIPIIDRADSIVMVDSVMANLTDQLGLGEDRYFIQRSHIGLTPVLGQHWTWIP